MDFEVNVIDLAHMLVAVCALVEELELDVAEEGVEAYGASL